MQIQISQSRQFKYSIVCVVKVAINYNCFPTFVQHFVVKKCFYFKTPDGAASISSPSYCFRCDHFLMSYGRLFWPKIAQKCIPGVL